MQKQNHFKKKYPARVLLYVCFAVNVICFAACSNIDCPLSNTVSAKYIFYSSSSNASAVIKDTLTVKAMGTDTVLYNLGVNLSELSLPVSYNSSADTLLFCVSNSGESRTDTLVVAHTNEAHFESIDCSPAMFHKITTAKVISGTGSTKVTQIDSVAVNNPKVNYNVVENIKVYVTLP